MLLLSPSPWFNELSLDLNGFKKQTVCFCPKHCNTKYIPTHTLLGPFLDSKYTHGPRTHCPSRELIHYSRVNLSASWWGVEM